MGILLYGFNGFNQTVDVQRISKKTDSLVRAYEQLGIFSGVVLLAEKGTTFYHKAFGLSDRLNNIPNTVQTQFIIGSMNKSFTQTIILQLMDEQRLQLSDNMVHYLDGFHQPKAGNITIQQLVEHSSGFGDYHGPDFFNLPYEQKNSSGILSLIKNLDLLFEPGTEHAYSNAGYIVLGAIIEKITGKSYAQNVEERIVKPLGLTTLVTKNIKEFPNRAIGYIKTIQGYKNNEDFVFEPRSDGGFYCTAKDMLTFYRSYFYDTVLFSNSARNKSEFFNTIKPAYHQRGSGIPIAGGFNGANTVHFEMLHDRISILVFANMDEPVAEKLALGIHKIINNKQPEKAELPTMLRVYKAYQDFGKNYVKKNFNMLIEQWFEGDPKDRILNNLGYELLQLQKRTEAIEIFKLNTELFADIGNCWDSLGEALRLNNQNKEALEAYRMALKHSPQLKSAQKAIFELEQKH